MKVDQLKNFKSFTLGMIKSHIVEDQKIGLIVTMIEQSDLTLLDMRFRQLGRAGAEEFYAEHKGRPYFEGLIGSITSSPVYALLLASEDDQAISKWRKLMGATDPDKAASGTIRIRHGKELPFNAVHGADSQEAFEREAEFFFGVLPGITRST